MGQEMVSAYRCDVCGYKWLPRKSTVPVFCPAVDCRSRRWNNGDEQRGPTSGSGENTDKGAVDGGRGGAVEVPDHGDRGLPAAESGEAGDTDEVARVKSSPGVGGKQGGQVRPDVDGAPISGLKPGTMLPSSDTIEAETLPPIELCLECASPLVWNKVLKWWQCTDCSWHGKRER